MSLICVGVLLFRAFHRRCRPKKTLPKSSGTPHAPMLIGAQGLSDMSISGREEWCR